MREATIKVTGNFVIDDVLAVARLACGSELSDGKLLVDSGPEALAKNNPGEDWIIFDGKYVDNAVLSAVREIHKHFPALDLSAVDEVGNEIDWASKEIVTPFVYPEPFFSNKKETIAVDIDTSVVSLIERQAKRHGNSISEEVSEWVTERAVQAA